MNVRAFCQHLQEDKMKRKTNTTGNCSECPSKPIFLCRLSLQVENDGVIMVSFYNDFLTCGKPSNIASVIGKWHCKLYHYQYYNFQHNDYFYHVFVSLLSSLLYYPLWLLLKSLSLLLFPTTRVIIIILVFVAVKYHYHY